MNFAPSLEGSPQCGPRLPFYLLPLPSQGHYNSSKQPPFPEPASILASCCLHSPKNVPSSLSNFPFCLPKCWPVLQVLSQMQLQRSFCWCPWISVIPISTKHPTPALCLYNTYWSVQTWTPFSSSTLDTKLLEGDKCALLSSESPMV